MKNAGFWTQISIYVDIIKHLRISQEHLRTGKNYRLVTLKNEFFSCNLAAHDGKTDDVK